MQNKWVRLLKGVFTRSGLARFSTRLEWVQCIAMVLFTHDMKKIKNSLKNATCKQLVSDELPLKHWYYTDLLKGL